MAFFLNFFIFILGLLVGSFLNCVIYRLEKKESFLKGRSYCPYCKQSLCWLDLIPVISFLFLKGKCRYCKKPISPQYPIIEISTALIFLFIFNSLPLLAGFNAFSSIGGSSVFNFLNLIYYWIISCFLIVIFAYDLKHYIIPDKVVYPAVFTALIFDFQFLIFNQFLNFKLSILSALGAAAFFLAIVLISRGRWMGIGDIKLAFLMGLILGWPNILVALFSAFFMGAIVGTALVVINKKTLKSEVPFGPFLATGTAVALFFGQNIINWYLKFFLLE